MKEIRLKIKNQEGIFRYLGHLKKEPLESHIIYQETLEPGHVDTVTIVIKENKLGIKRLGGEMLFIPSKKTDFHYETPYGFLVFSIETVKLIIKQGVIQVCYRLFSEKDELIKEETLELTYEER